MKTSEQIEDYLKTYSVGCAEAQAEKNGLLTALKIAEAHEAEYGWLPIATAPLDGKRATVRIGSGPPLSAVHNFKDAWIIWRTELTVYPTEWYKYEEDE